MDLLVAARARRLVNSASSTFGFVASLLGDVRDVWEVLPESMGSTCSFVTPANASLGPSKIFAYMLEDKLPSDLAVRVARLF